MSGRQITVADAGRFALAGDAIFTMVRPQRVLAVDGEETVDPEKRYTYRIQRADGEEPTRPWFVKVLNGPDNVRNFQYLGCIFPRRHGEIVYFHGKKSRVSDDAGSAKGIAWFVRHINTLIDLRGQLEDAGLFPAPVEQKIAKVEGTLNQLHYYHEGRCGACARRLTVPESIVNGIGPKCAKKFGLPGILERLARL